MEQRTDTAARQAAMAEDLGRRMRALFFLALIVNSARSIARIVHRITDQRGDEFTNSAA